MPPDVGSAGTERSGQQHLPVRAPVFSRTAFTWSLTVCSESTSRSATSWVESAVRRAGPSTSVSRPRARARARTGRCARPACSARSRPRCRGSIRPPARGPIRSAFTVTQRLPPRWTRDHGSPTGTPCSTATRAAATLYAAAGIGVIGSSGGFSCSRAAAAPAVWGAHLEVRVEHHDGRVRRQQLLGDVHEGAGERRPESRHDVRRERAEVAHAPHGRERRRSVRQSSSTPSRRAGRRTARPPRRRRRARAGPRARAATAHGSPSRRDQQRRRRHAGLEELGPAVQPRQVARPDQARQPRPREHRYVGQRRAATRVTGSVSVNT